jgi:hypothetical protein
MAETPANFSEFDAHAAGEALGAQPRILRDVNYGDGHVFDVDTALLEVYPKTGITRVTTTNARVELYDVPRYSVRDERVVFEQGEEDNRQRLQIRADGKVAFHPVLRAAEAPRTEETAPGGHKGSPTAVSASEATTAPSSTTPAATEGKEQEVVTLRGRVGRFFSSDLDAQPPTAAMSFAVPVPTQEDPDWWKVVATHGLAVDLHTWRFRERPAKLTTGWRADVTGQIEITERTGKDGTPRTDRIMYAQSVTPIKPPWSKTPRQRPTQRPGTP